MITVHLSSLSSFLCLASHSFFHCFFKFGYLNAGTKSQGGRSRQDQRLATSASMCYSDSEPFESSSPEIESIKLSIFCATQFASWTLSSSSHQDFWNDWSSCCFSSEMCGLKADCFLDLQWASSTDLMQCGWWVRQQYCLLMFRACWFKNIFVTMSLTFSKMKLYPL